MTQQGGARPGDSWDKHGPDARKQYAEFEMFGVVYKAPELRHFASGMSKAMAYISYRKNRKDKNTGEFVAEYHGWDCEVWGDLGQQFAEQVVEKDAVIVRGRLKVDKWEDKKTGEKRSKTVMDVLEFEIVSHEADRLNRGKEFKEKRDAANQRLAEKQETEGYPVDGDMPF